MFEYIRLMISVPMALAALALAGAAPAHTKASANKGTASEQANPKKATDKERAAQKSESAEAAPDPAIPYQADLDQAIPDQENPDQATSDEAPSADNQDVAVPPPEISAEAERVADWVNASADNRKLPYIIVDKPAARAFLFDAKGKPLASAPVLIGKALGDDATPGIGAKSLAEIGPAEKTTPAGRFLAKFGLAAGNQKVLWVDYATSVALHTIPVGNKENRRARMLSTSIEDNRITFGCINVPKAFYNNGVVPLFRKKGGYVYVLPDSKPIEEVFPRLRVQAVLSSSASSAAQPK